MSAEKKTGTTTCAVLVILGVVFLLFPTFSLSFIGLLVGLGLLVFSISGIIAWSRRLKGSPTGTPVLVFAIITLIIALICVFHPLALSMTISWLIAFAILAVAIAQLCTLFSMGKFPGRTPALAISAIDALFGICALVWPSMLIQFVGIAFILEGIELIILMLKARPIDVDPL